MTPINPIKRTLDHTLHSLPLQPAVRKRRLFRVRRLAQALTLKKEISAILACLVFFTAIASAEPHFWESGSAIYTNRESWEQDCRLKEEKQAYRIGDDIVACVTTTTTGNPRNLVMTPASNFTELELSKMTDSTTSALLPLRSHPRFLCLRVTSGWMC